MPSARLQDRNSELAAKRLRDFIQNSTETIWCVEFDEPLPLDLPETGQLEHIQTHAFISEANDAWAAQVGLESGDELVGLRISELLPISEPENLDALLRLIRARFELRDFETAEYARSGEKRVVINNCSGVFENGCLVRAWGTARDVTDQRRAELEAHELRETLAHMDRTERMGQLAGAIGHELNQSLTGILSNAQAGELMLKHGELDPSEASALLSDIVSDAKRARDVLTSLRDLFRQQTTELHELDINELVRATLTFLNSEFVLSGVEVSTDLSVDAERVQGNRVQLQQVILNLAANAQQAMEQSPGRERRIALTTSRLDEGRVQVSVEDTGTGIEADHLEKIFEPMQTTKSDGLGMGLAICRSILQAHGGRIWAENVAGAGARLSFSLPAAPAP